MRLTGGVAGLVAALALAGAAWGQITPAPLHNDGSTHWSATDHPTTPAPDGYAGGTISYTTEEVGKPSTPNEGFRRSLTQSVTMMAPKCPDHAGVVEGRYLVETHVITTPAGGGPATDASYIADATMKGQVGEDAVLQWIDAHVVITRTGGGMPPGVATYSERLTPLGRGYASGTAAMNVLVVSDGDMSLNLAMVSTMLRSQGLLAFDAAEREWRSPNACVQLVLEPPTQTQEMQSGDTIEVAASLVVVADRGGAPDRSLFKAQPVGEGARVEPAETPVAVKDGKQTLAFTAGSPKPGGFKLRVTSVSGIAEGEWRAKEAPDYYLSQSVTAVVDFTKTILARSIPTKVTMQTQFTKVRLTWRGDKLVPAKSPVPVKVTLRAEPPCKVGLKQYEYDLSLFGSLVDETYDVPHFYAEGAAIPGTLIIQGEIGALPENSLSSGLKCRHTGFDHPGIAPFGEALAFNLNNIQPYVEEWSDESGEPFAVTSYRSVSTLIPIAPGQ